MGGVAWTEEEDDLLKRCIEQYGEGKWHRVPLLAGLNRCRKSCRLRWLNYLRPNIRRGTFTDEEVDLIIKLHKLVGNRWSLIAGRLPGRTANDVKNFWNCHLSKKLNAEETEFEETKQDMMVQNTFEIENFSASSSIGPSGGPIYSTLPSSLPEGSSLIPNHVQDHGAGTMLGDAMPMDFPYYEVDNGNGYWEWDDFTMDMTRFSG
ncbi:hypothetical protein MLD38_018588 [Melastoma candidum]|uniref:Uncharacterized protein n=1 Tax=Melastoma candidum TaxID=119954 RepID=A0ACB9QYC4_9MYRT|nr:hypothetical protein MLD38_018588 [Melastoma candidum]